MQLRRPRILSRENTHSLRTHLRKLCTIFQQSCDALIIFILSLMTHYRSFTFRGGLWARSCRCLWLCSWLWLWLSSTCKCCSCWTELPWLTLRHSWPMPMSVGRSTAVNSTAEPTKLAECLTVTAQWSALTFVVQIVCWHPLWSKAMIVCNCDATITEITSHQSTINTWICSLCSWWWSPEYLQAVQLMLDVHDHTTRYCCTTKTEGFRLELSSHNRWINSDQIAQLGQSTKQCG